MMGRLETASPQRAARRIFVVLVALVLLVAPTDPVGAGAQDLYLTNGTGPTDLYEVDLTMNTARYLMTFSFAEKVHALTFCPDAVEGYVGYVIGRENATLARLDMGGGSETVVGTLPAEFTDAIVQASCGRDGLLYFTDSHREELWTLDIATCPSCAPVLVGRVETAPGAADIDLEGADIQHDVDGALYLATNTDRSLCRLDKSNALATYIGPMDTGTNTGMAITIDDELLISSNDDNLYEVDRATAEATSMAMLWDGQKVIDIDSGDLGSPTPFECQLQAELEERSVRRGELLRWAIALRHHATWDTETRFYYWIARADGEPVTPVARTPRVEITYLDELRIERSFEVPRELEPGEYVLHLRVRSMRQGLATAAARFEVLP